MRTIARLLVIGLAWMALGLLPVLAVAQQTNLPVPDRVPTTNGPSSLDELHLRRRFGEPLPVRSPAPAANEAVSPSDVPANFLDWNRAVAMVMSYPTWDLLRFDKDHPFNAPWRLTSNSVSETGPRLNRAADRVLFNRKPGSVWQVSVMNIDGSNQIDLTDGKANNLGAAWSPDDARIVFYSKRDPVWEIYVMNADGSKAVRLTNDSADDFAPAWSPDGQWIAWFKTPAGGSVGGLWLMHPDGSNPHLIADGLRYPQDLVWSPDSTQLAFDYDADWDGWNELAVIDANGSNLHVIYDMWSYSEPWPSDWSSDGHIYFTMVNFVPYCSSSGCWYEINTTAILRISPDTSVVESVLGDIWNNYLSFDLEPLEHGMPFSSMSPLPATSPARFDVNWSGGDVGPAGLLNFDVQVKDGASAWRDWEFLTGTTVTTGQYLGTGGHTYYFRVRARDNAFNLEPWPATYDAATTVESAPPQAALDPLPKYARGPLTVNWHGSDPGGSGIQIYETQYRDVASAAWTNWETRWDTQAVFAGGEAGHTYEFRVRARDWANNVGSWSVTTGARVTFYAWGIAGNVADHSGKPVVGLNTTLTPNALGTLDNTTRSIYGAYTSQAGAYQVSWQSAGYGLLPSTAFPYDPVRDEQLDVFLPPLDNVVTNGNFEAVNALDNWQIGGSSVPSASTAIYHTGQQAAQLGDDGVLLGVTSEPIFAATNPALAVDEAQTVHLITAVDLGAGYTSLRYAARPVTGTWPLAPTRIITADGVLTTLALAPDQSGGVHIVGVWGNSSRSDIYYCHYAPTINTCPAPIKLTNNTNSKIDAVTISADEAGGLHVAFSASSGTFYRYLPPGGSWNPVETVAEDNAGTALHLRLDQSGVRHLLWSRNEGLWNNAVYYTTKPTAGAWQTPTAVLSGAWEQVAADVGLDGSVYIVWMGTGAVYATEKLPGAAWTTTSIDIASSYYTPYVLRVNRVGVVQVLMRQEFPNDTVISMIKEPNQAWQLLNGVSYPLPIAADIDARGIVHIVAQEPPISLLTYAHTTYHLTPITSSLSQSVTLPAGLRQPIGLFLYRAEWPNDFGYLSASVDTGLAATEVFSSSRPSAGWQHAVFDMSAWAGQAVTLSFALEQPIGSLGVAVMVDEVAVGSSLTPIVTGLSLARADAWTTMPITITGDNFVATPAVKIGATALTGVQWIDEHTLTATLPDLPPGPQGPIWVTNPGGQSAVLLKSILVGRLTFLPLIALNYFQ